MREPLTLPALLLIIAVPLCASTSPPAAAGGRIHVQPPQLALLARHLQQLDATARWEFASITLEVLQAVYRRELQAAAQERAGRTGQRAKLARWRRATGELVAELQAARQRLDGGAPFSVYADPQHQVLIVVDGRPILVSGPRLETEQAIERQVIARFCAFNDCSVLAAEALARPEPAASGAGVWVLAANAPPTFEVEGVLRCEFQDLGQRRRKGEACRRVADESLQLAEAMQAAQRQGYRIDWDWLATSPPSPAVPGQVVVNRDGAYLALPSGTLARLHPADWQTLLARLRAADDAGLRDLVLRHAERLLQGGAGD
jgi:hypothetical protein